MTSEQAEGGPSAWVIVLGTLLAGVIFGGVVLGYRAWRDRGDDAADDPTASTQVPDSTIAGERPAARLFTRTTDDGIEVRVDSMAMAGQGGEDFFGPVAEDAPAFCHVVDQVSVFAISAESVLQGGLPITEGPPPEPAAVPMWSGPGGNLVGVVMQVADDVSIVRLAVPGEAVDEMAPVGGVVALAVEADIDEQDPGRLEDFGLPDLGGAVVTVHHRDGRTVRASTDPNRGPPVWVGDETCFRELAPPAPPDTVDPENNPFVVRLPPPGIEQPVDPAAAQPQIEAAFAALYAPGDPAADVLAYVDDPFAMRETFTNARATDQWDAIGFDRTAATIEEIVFLTSVEAAFEYELHGPTLDQDELFGRARLVDGTWRLTRGTICRDLANVGIECPP